VNTSVPGSSSWSCRLITAHWSWPVLHTATTRRTPGSVRRVAREGRHIGSVYARQCLQGQGGCHQVRKHHRAREINGSGPPQREVA
jgi:hypothetical protein